MKHIDDIIDYIPFWGQLNEAERDSVRSGLTYREFDKGELISGSKDSCMGLIIVHRGDVRVSILSEDGRQITLFHAVEGDICALTAACVIEQLTFDTVISAEKDTGMWIIPTMVLDRIAAGNIYIRAYIYELLLERFSTVVWVMEQILFLGLDKRLAGFLVSCYDRDGSEVIVMTQEEIASEINTAREVVARMLKQFAADGLVELRRGRIIVKDIDKLRSI